MTSCSKGVDHGYPVYGGIFREEAIMLLRRFYVQENEKGIRSPVILTSPSLSVCKPGATSVSLSTKLSPTCPPTKG